MRKSLMDSDRTRLPQAGDRHRTRSRGGLT
jgi:hypothetical protein